MTREIKFRALVEDWESWLPVDRWVHWSFTEKAPTKILKETATQYTGLKDKNGKEIYEGDIVKGYYDFGHGKMGLTGKVFYDHSGFRIEVIEGDDERPRQVNYADFIESDGTIYEKIEIIGNIYENPELLDNK